MTHILLPKNVNKDNVTMRQGKPDYSKLAAAAFPSPASSEQGAILDITDTGDRYIWTSTNWIQTHSAGKLLTTATIAANVTVNLTTVATATIAAAIALNAATSTLVLAVNAARKYVHITTDAAADPIWLKLQAAAVDNVAKGIYLSIIGNGSNSWTMPTDAVYTGEISAIAVSGTPNIYVTSY